MKRSIIHLVFWSLGSWLLGDEAVVVSPPASPRISAQADFAKQETAPNKVPVINIAQPNNAGVSHNCYEKFNVQREGLILNNSTVAAQSKLGGMLMGNANLARTGSASLIVNEVTGPTQSQINGFVEVHGKAADLVVANPNGISVNGGGFINAPKVTLTTGVPEFDANGALQSLLVQQGKVTVGDQGMHVQNCNYCDILANAVEINGAIQGQKSEHEGTDMRVVSGYYRFDYPSRTAYEEGGGAPVMGVDSSALGGMYAGKIYFVAKGRDVGVKLPPNMTTNVGDLVVESDGSIHIAGHVNSAGLASLRSSKNISSENAKLGARDKINMSANSVNITSTGVFTPQTLSINATDAFRSSESRLNSEKALRIQAGSMESIKDHFASLEPIHFETTRGDLSLKRTALQTPWEARLHSAGNLALNGQINAKRRLNLTSTGTLHQEGILEAVEGGITTQSSADALIKGKWTARDGICIGSDASVAIKNRSLLSSEGSINVNATREASLSGTIRTKDKATFIGNNGIINGCISGKNVEIMTDGSLQMVGELRANEPLRIKSGEIQSRDTKLFSNQGVAIESTTGDLALANAEIQSPADVVLISAQNIDFDGTLKTNEAVHLTGNQDIRMKGTLQGRTARLRAQRNLSVEPTSDVKVAEALALEATNDVALQGKTQSDGLTISGDNIRITDQHISQGKIDVTAQNEVKNDGEVSSNDDIQLKSRVAEIAGNVSGKNVVIETTETLQMTGETHANERLQVSSKKVDITGGKLRANENVVVSSTAEDLTLNRVEVETPMDIVLNSAKNIAFEGSLKTNEAVQLESQQDVRVKGSVQGRTARLRAQRNLSVEPTSDVKVAEALALEATNDVALQGQTQSGTLAISGANIHVADQHVSQGKIDIMAENEAKVQGTLVSIDDGIDIKADSSIKTDCIVNAKKDVTLGAQNLDQNGGIFSREGSVRIQTKQAKLSGDLLGTTGLEIKSEDAINLEDTTQIASKGPIVITSNDMHLAGKLDTEGSIDLKANTLGLKSRTALSGKSIALQQTGDKEIQWDDVTLQGEQQVTVKSPGDVKISGSVLSSGEVMIESGKSMDFSSSTDSRIGGKTTLKAKHMLSLSGLLVGLSSMLFSAEDVTVQPQVQIESASANIVIDAQKTFAVQPNSAVAGKDLSVKSPTVTNEGLIQGSNSVDLNAAQNLSNNGQILTAGELTVETPKLENNGLLQSASGEFNVADLTNKGGMWIAGPWTLQGDKALNTGWIRIDGPWKGKFNTFENQAGWVKGATVDFADPMRWLNKARMDFSGDVLLPLSTFENVSASFYSGGDVVLDTLRNVSERTPVVTPMKEQGKCYTNRSGKKLVMPKRYSHTGQSVSLQNLLLGYTPDEVRSDMDDFHDNMLLGYKRITTSCQQMVQNEGKRSVFYVNKNLRSFKDLTNICSDLLIKGELTQSSVNNQGYQVLQQDVIATWKLQQSRGWHGRDYCLMRFVDQDKKTSILASAPATIRVGGKIQGTVKSFMNGQAVAKDDNIKQGVALSAHVETVWDKEKAALKVLREAHAEPVRKLHFSAPEVDAGADLSPVGAVAMAAVPSAEVVPVEEDERTQLWRLQVQDFLNEARAETLVFSPKYDAPYVIETNPMFVDPGLFYGSQYFLDRVDLTSGGKPSIETRLGDAFFENQLIRQQIQAATNRFILSHQYANEAEQQLALYNNALDDARELGLTVGVPLTPDQVKKLKRDLIWLVTEEVDGKQVLVPRVYLCANTKCNLCTSASQILAKSIDLQVDGNVLNQGLIETEQDLSIRSSGTIANIAGKFSTEKGDLSLQADGDVLNISGEIASGKDLAVSAKKIVSATTKERMDGYKSHADILGAQAKISAKDTLHLSADEHLAAVGTAFKGKDVALTSGGDMTLDVAEKTYHYQDGGHNWSINEHGAHALQTTIEADKDVHLIAQDDLKTRAVKVHAGGDFEVKSERGAVTSEAFKDYDYAYYYSHTDGGFFGGSSTTESTSYKAKDVGSDIVAQEAGTLSAEKDVHLKAGRVAAKDLTLASKSGKVKLEAGEDKDFYHYYHKSNGLITTSVDDEGHDRTTQKPVEVVAQNITLPGPAEIDYKAGLGKEFREALADRPDINWNAVADNYREWSEHTTTLSGPARMLVACVLTVATNGMGSEWLAAHGIAEGTAMNAALSAGIQGVVVGAGTSLAGNLGDIGKTFDELTSADFIKGLASTMLMAGLKLGEANSLKEGVVKGAEKIAIQTTLEGKNLGEILVGNIVDANAAQIAEKIGDAKAADNLNPIAHKALHAGLGAASKALTGGDALAGAIGAAASETAAEAMDKPDTTHEERQKIAQKARIIGDTVAFLAGRDVASADSAGRNAVENNWLPDHLVEIDGQRALMKLLPEEIAAEELERLDLDERVTIEAMKNPIVNTIAVGVAGMGVPLVAQTAGVLGTAATAHYFGSIAVDSGAKGLVQEAKDHPIMTTLAVMPFLPGPKVLKVTQGTPKALVKTEQAVQQEFRFGQKIGETVARETAATTTTAKIVSTEAKAVQQELGFVQGLTPSTKISETVVDTGKRWSKTMKFEGTTIHQRDSFIDPMQIDPITGKTNYELMKAGKAPIGPDGKAIELHHVLQEEGPLVELTRSMHKKYYPQIHMFSKDKTFRSSIDRPAFDAFRGRYWVERAKTFEEFVKNVK